MRFMKLYSFTGNNDVLQQVAKEFNRKECAVVPNLILDAVCRMLAEAEVYHLLTERKDRETTIVVYANEHDYHKGLAQMQERKQIPIYFVKMSSLLKDIDFDHSDHTWVELRAGDSIVPDDIKTAIREAVSGIAEPYNEDRFFVVDREWHIRRVVHLVQQHDRTPILIGCREEENGNETDLPLISDGKHRFMAATVRGDVYIRAIIASSKVRYVLSVIPSIGIAKDDISLKSGFSGRPIQVRKGDSFEVVDLEDTHARVRFTSGEANGKKYFLDQMLLTFGSTEIQ